MENIIFERKHFHPDACRVVASSDAEILTALQILNSLSEEQKRVVCLYGFSRFEEGYDSGKAMWHPTEDA